MEVKTFNSDQEAFDAGFRNPMGNGTYARDDGPMEQAAHLVRDWIADFGLALSDIEEGELIRRIALRAACDEPAKAGFNAGWNAAMEEAAKLMEDWMERNELVAPIASAIRKMKSRPKRCLNDEDRFHWLWAIAERSRLLVSEWHKYRDPIAPPLLDQLAELRNLLGERPNDIPHAVASDAEIDQLRTENKRMLEALQRIADQDVVTEHRGRADILAGIAWSALPSDD